MSTDNTTAARRGSESNDLLGLAPERDHLGWHALNYRTAHTVHAEAMWQELVACIERREAAAVAAERERWKEMLEERGRIHGESSRIYARLASAVRAGADDVVLGQLLRAEVRNRA